MFSRYHDVIETKYFETRQVSKIVLIMLLIVIFMISKTLCVNWIDENGTNRHLFSDNNAVSLNCMRRREKIKKAIKTIENNIFIFWIVGLCLYVCMYVCVCGGFDTPPQPVEIGTLQPHSDHLQHHTGKHLHWT